MTHPPSWAVLISWLDEAILFGTANRPIPLEIRTIATDWGVDLSDDPDQAILELLTVASVLQDGTLSRSITPETGNNNRPESSQIWTRDQVIAIRELLEYPQVPGMRETAWLLRRNGWQWPEATVPTLLDLMSQHPTLWSENQDLLPPLAVWMAGQLQAHALTFPDGPPPNRSLSLDAWPHFLHRWIQRHPQPALDWLQTHSASLPPEIWEPWLTAYSPFLPEETLPLLIKLTPEEYPLPWLQARIRCGDVELIQDVQLIVRSMIQMTNDQLDLTLPAAGPAWEWTGYPSTQSGFRRKKAFADLVSCLPPSAWTDWFSLDINTFYSRVFTSPDAATLVPAIYGQLLTFPEPAHCLGFLQHRLLHLDITLPAPETPLTQYIRSADLAPLVDREIRRSRFQLIPGSPAWNLLMSPYLYWTEPLLEGVLQVFQSRPAFSYEAATDEDFVTALAWRGPLGGLLRRSQKDGLRQVFPGPFARLAPYILEVIQCRKRVHQALDTRQQATG